MLTYSDGRNLRDFRRCIDKGESMRIIKISSVWLVFFLVLTSCSVGNDPQSVAEKFWDAMANRDIETARSYATRASRESLSVDKDKEGDVQVTFGEMTEKEGEVSIATTMKQSDGGKEQSIPMQTILVQEEGAWKVDAERTMFSILGGAMGQMMDSLKQGVEDFGKAFRDGMQKSE